MRITIRKDAKSAYVGRTVTGHNAWTDWDWACVLEILQGETLEIDTKFLFKTQLNTAPLPPERIRVLLSRIPKGSSKKCYKRCRNAMTSGIRAMNWMWSSIEDDIRPTRKLCRWCHHHSDIAAEQCENCENSSHFESLVIGERLRC